MIFKCASHGTVICFVQSNPATVFFWVWWGPWGPLSQLLDGWGQRSQWRAAARRWPLAECDADQGAQAEGHQKGLQASGPVAARRQHQKADRVLRANAGSRCCDGCRKCARTALAHWVPNLVPSALLPFALCLGSLELTPLHVLCSCHCAVVTTAEETARSGAARRLGGGD